MKVIDYLSPHLVAFLDVATRNDAIDALIALLESQGKLPNQERFRTAILQREALVSTGIGIGVAVPHAKLAELNDFFIIIGIQRQKGIDWNALDKIPVRLIFLIGGPENRQSEYLQILSQLTSAIKEVELRKELLKATTPEEVISLFQS
ncbi:MAG TPA: PTS sugar transporter subunit IIA [Chlamydiales bacterium]|jgi:PTS system nitrogen regulatory IIA component